MELSFIFNYGIKWHMGWVSMQDTEMQIVATNIVVISVALLAVTIIMFSAAWQGLMHYIGLLSAQGHREIATMIFWSYVFFSAVFGVYIAMAYWGPNLVRILVFLVLLVFAVIEIVYLVFIFVWNIVRHRGLPRLQVQRNRMLRNGKK